jgi:hypothetical protein
MSEWGNIGDRLLALEAMLGVIEQELGHGPSDRLSGLPDAVAQLCAEITNLSGEDRETALSGLLRISARLERLDRIARDRLAEANGQVQPSAPPGG